MKKSIIGMVILILASFLLCTTNVYAASSVTINETDNDPYQLSVTRNIKNVTNNITNTFGYTVTPDAGNPEGATNEPTAFSVVYDNIAPNSTTHIATKTGNLNFTGATYTKVGDYKYIVQEASSTDSATYPVVPTKYEVYVSVRYAVDEKGVQTGDLVATLASQVINQDDRETGKQDMVYPNETAMTYINISKNVTGNMADTNEYFKFLVKINGVTGDNYQIIGQDDEVQYNGTKINTSGTYTVGDTDQYVYLKNGQSITIGLTNEELKQIKMDTEFQIVEQDATTYKTFINGSTTDSKDSGKLTTVEETDSNAAKFVNNKEEITLTGVFFEIAPYAIVVIIAVIGILYIVKSKKNDYKN